MTNVKSVKQRKKISLLFLTSFFVVFSAWAQNKITGVVRDHSGELSGVTVSVEGNQTIGTTTDTKGEFSITVPTTAKNLVFKFLGKETMVFPIAGKNYLQVVLLDQSVNLNEVVTIGYGTIKKKDLTGAVSVVNSNDFKNMRAMSVADALQGLASGISIRNGGAIGSEPIIEIRGIGNFTNSTPLFVIDGLVSTGGLRDLNANDVESIQVLKDASAAAIYGNRAANGVILITTKRGKKGEMKVNFSVKHSVDRTPRINLMDTTQFFKYNDMAYENAGLKPQNHYTNNTDWQKEIFQTGFTKDYNVGFSGGTDKSNYLVSMNYFDNAGTTKGTNITRYSFRVNTEGKRGIFTIGENLAITDTRTVGSSSGNPYVDVVRMTPNIAVKDSLHPGGYGYGDEARARTFGSNPVAMQNLVNNTNGNTRIRGNVYVNVQFTDWLSYKMNGGYETSLDWADSFRKFGSWSLNQPQDPSSLNSNKARYESKLFENTLNFNKSLGKHNMDAVLGISYQNEKYNLIWGNVQNLLQVSGNYFDVLDAGQANPTTGGYRTESNLISYLGRVNYSYDNRYLFSGTFRNDATSKFGPAYRSGIFPSVSAGWRVSNEEFFNLDWISDLKLRANYGSLGNAAIGNYTYVATLSHFPLYTFGTAQTVTNGLTQIHLANQDLQWETKTQKNFGMDIAFLKNKLQFSAEYYISTTKDVLVPAPILLATGNDGGAPLANAASLENRGVELTATWKDQVGDFKYSVGLNMNHLDNKVLSLGYGKQEVLTGLCKTEVGQPIGMFYLIKANGIFKSQEEIDNYVTTAGTPVIYSNGKRPSLGDVNYSDVNDDGIISASGDRQISGSPWPTFEAGLNLNAEYKHFDASVIGFGAFGQKVFNGLSSMANYFADNSNYIVGVNPYTETNTETNTPRIIYGDDRNSRGDQDRWLEDGSYFKIKAITLGYTFKMPSLANYVDNLRLAVTGQNLITFTKYTGLDPEFANGYIYERGVDPTSYPSAKSFIFSLNVTF